MEKKCDPEQKIMKDLDIENIIYIDLETTDLFRYG